MLSFYFSPITHECILFYKLSLQKWTDSFSLDEDGKETSTHARQCLNICQFKIGQGYVRKKQNVPSSRARDTKRVGGKKLLDPRAIWENWTNQGLVGSRTRSTINPRRICHGVFAFVIWTRGGVAVEAAVWFISNRFSRNRDNSPALNFYFSPRSPSSTIVTPAPSASSSRSPVLEWLRYSMLLRPRSNRPTWINRTADSLPPLITEYNDIWTSR